MTPAEARALAGDRRAELHRRARRIRRSVGAVAAALFVALFLIVYVQLASGHDPALSASSKARSTSAVHKGSSGSSGESTTSSAAKASESDSTGGESTSSTASESSAGTAAEGSEAEASSSEEAGAEEASSEEAGSSSSSESPSAVRTSQS
jgi:hypothetical protein